jgi:histidine triad (HIT) family protein
MPGGINLLQCNGKAAAQSVFHFHMHVIPRAMGDGLAMNWEITPGDMAAIGELAEKIKAEIV